MRSYQQQQHKEITGAETRMRSMLRVDNITVPSDRPEIVIIVIFMTIFHIITVITIFIIITIIIIIYYCVMQIEINILFAGFYSVNKTSNSTSSYSG